MRIIIKNLEVNRNQHNDLRMVIFSKIYNLSSFINKLIVGQIRHIPCGNPEQAEHLKEAISTDIVGKMKKSQSED